MCGRHRRGKLRSGIQQGTCGSGSPLPRCPSQDCQKVLPGFTKPTSVTSVSCPSCSKTQKIMIVSARDLAWSFQVSENVLPKAEEIPEAHGHPVITILDVSERQRKHLLAGGTLNYVKKELRSA